MNIKVNTKYKENDVLPSESFFRKNERDLIPKKVVLSIDEYGFIFSQENIENLHFDNSGKYFVEPENSFSQINKVISDILKGKKIEPVVINKKGNVLDGQHRMCAFHILGIKKIPVFKSLMNDTLFDNLSTRRRKFDIPFEEDFFKQEHLEQNQDYQNFITNNLTSFLKHKSSELKRDFELALFSGKEAFNYLDKYGNDFSHKYSLAPERDHIFAIKDNQIVGIALLQDQEKSKKLQIKDTVTLSNLIVHPEYLQQGISKLLINHLVNYLKENNLILRRTDPTKEGKEYLFDNLTAKLKELDIPFVTEESSWIYKEFQTQNPNKSSQENFELYTKFINKIVIQRTGKPFELYLNNYDFEYEDLQKLKNNKNKKSISI